MAKTAKGKKGRKGARKGKKAMVPRSRRFVNTSDFARVRYTFANDLQLTTGNVFGMYNFALTNSARAQAVAAGYQYYRIASVHLKVKPNADTYDAFQVATLPNPPGYFGMPYLYYMIDKTGNFDANGTSLTALKAAGARAIIINEKPFNIHFKPAVQIGSSDSGSPPGPAPLAELAAAFKTSPWLTTNANSGEPGSAWAPNSVDHMGITLGVESQRQTGSWPAATVTITVVYEFKKPLWQVPPGETITYTKADLDVLGVYNPAPALKAESEVVT